MSGSAGMVPGAEFGHRAERRGADYRHLSKTRAAARWGAVGACANRGGHSDTRHRARPVGAFPACSAPLVGVLTRTPLAG